MAKKFLLWEEKLISHLMQTELHNLHTIYGGNFHNLIIDTLEEHLDSGQMTEPERKLYISITDNPRVEELNRIGDSLKPTEYNIRNIIEDKLRELLESIDMPTEFHTDLNLNKLTLRNMGNLMQIELH